MTEADEMVLYLRAEADLVKARDAETMRKAADLISRQAAQIEQMREALDKAERRAEAAESALSTARAENASLWVRVESGEAAAHAQGAEEMQKSAVQLFDAQSKRLRQQYHDGDYTVNEDIMRADLAAERIRALPLPPGPAIAEAPVPVHAVEPWVEKVREAFASLIDRLDYIHDHPAYQSVWAVSQLHVGQYSGPQYGEELEAAREALALLPKPAGE